MRHRPIGIVLLLMAAAALSGCAGRDRLAAIGGKGAAVALPPRPTAPAGLPTPAQIPPADGVGGYATPGRTAGAGQAAWIVRSALNVAALSCRGPAEAATVAAYNAMLTRQAATFAAAYKAVTIADRATMGPKWQDGHDARMTRLYNFYAQPFAKAGFCAAAEAVLGRAATVPPAAFPQFATIALPELEAPFVAAYRNYAAYATQLAAWDATYAGRPGADGPRLAYAPLDALIAWEGAGRADRRQRLASAR